MRVQNFFMGLSFMKFRLLYIFFPLFINANVQIFGIEGNKLFNIEQKEEQSKLLLEIIKIQFGILYKQVQTLEEMLVISEKNNDNIFVGSLVEFVRDGILKSNKLNLNEGEIRDEKFDDGVLELTKKELSVLEDELNESSEYQSHQEKIKERKEKLDAKRYEKYDIYIRPERRQKLEEELGELVDQKIEEGPEEKKYRKAIDIKKTQKEFNSFNKDQQEWNILYVHFSLIRYYKKKNQLENIVDISRRGFEIKSPKDLDSINLVTTCFAKTDLELPYASIGKNFKPGEYSSSDLINQWFRYLQSHCYISNAIVTNSTHFQAFDEIIFAVKTNADIILTPYNHLLHFQLLVVNKLDKTITLIDSLSNCGNRPHEHLKLSLIYDWQIVTWATGLQNQNAGGKNSCGIHALVYATIIAQLGRFDEDVKRVILDLPNTRQTLKYIVGLDQKNSIHPKNDDLFNVCYRQELKELFNNK